MKKDSLSWSTKLITLGITAIATLSLSSCATLSKQECKLGDWQSIGYSDGANGSLPSHIGKHQKACSKANVLPNYKMWELGRQEGLKHYCTEANAYRLGKLGDSINNVCPVAMSNKLERINAKGRKIYKLKNQIESNQEKLDTYNEDLTKLKSGEMLGFNTEPEARKYMVELPAKIRKLEEGIETNQWLIDNENYR